MATILFTVFNTQGIFTFVDEHAQLWQTFHPHFIPACYSVGTFVLISLDLFSPGPVCGASRTLCLYLRLCSPWSSEWSVWCRLQRHLLEPVRHDAQQFPGQLPEEGRFHLCSTWASTQLGFRSVCPVQSCQKVAVWWSRRHCQSLFLRVELQRPAHRGRELHQLQVQRGRCSFLRRVVGGRRRKVGSLYVSVFLSCRKSVGGGGGHYLQCIRFSLWWPGPSLQLKGILWVLIPILQKLRQLCLYALNWNSVSVNSHFTELRQLCQCAVVSLLFQCSCSWFLSPCFIKKKLTSIFYTF